MRFERLWDFVCFKLWWFIVEWVAPCQPFLLNKGENRAGHCFLCFLPRWHTWQGNVGQTSDRLARLHQRDLPEQEANRHHTRRLPRLRVRLRWPRSTSLGHGFWDGRAGHSLRVCQMWTTRAWLTIVPSHRRTFLSGKSQNIENFFSLESGTPSTDFFFLWSQIFFPGKKRKKKEKLNLCLKEWNSEGIILLRFQPTFPTAILLTTLCSAVFLTLSPPPHTVPLIL